MSKSTWVWLLVLAGIIAGILLPLSPVYRPIPDVDQSVYLYVSARMLEGQVLYRDVWDHKQPFTYFIYALGLALSGGTLWGVWVIELVGLIAAAGLFFWLLRHFISGFLSFLVIAGGLLTLNLLIWGFSVEEFGLILQAASLAGAFWLYQTLGTKRALAAGLVFGLLAGGLFFLKQSLVGISAAVILVLAGRAVLHKEMGSLAAIAAAAAGFGLTILVVLAYLLLNGALPAYLQAAYAFNLDYANLGLLERIRAVLDALEYMGSVPGLFLTFCLWLVTALLALAQFAPRSAVWLADRHAPLVLSVAGAGLIAVSLAAELLGGDPGLGLAQITLILAGALLLIVGLTGLLPKLRDRVVRFLTEAALIPDLEGTETGRLQGFFLAVAAVYFPITLLLITLSGRNYVYYFIPLIPVFILQCGLLLSFLSSSAASVKSRQASGWVVLAVCAALAYNPALLLASAYRNTAAPYPGEIATYIDAHTRPEDTILAWGKYTTYAYFVSDRKAPTRYFYQAAVNEPAYDARYQISKQILEDITQQPPTLFLLSNDPSATPAASVDICPSITPDLNDSILKYICSRYQYQGGVAEFLVLPGEALIKSQFLLTTTLSTPLGSMQAAASPKGICLLEFDDDPVRLARQTRRVQQRLEGMLRPGDCEPLDQLQQQMDEYFAGKRKSFDLPFDDCGTPFQRSIWQAVWFIPYGQTCTYQEIARRLNRPQSARAVGSANGQNPLSILIPCHRLVNQSGGLSGYGGGLWRKQALLDLEAQVLRRDQREG